MRLRDPLVGVISDKWPSKKWGRRQDDLGLIGGPIILGIYLFSMIFLFFYPITKERYREIRVVLDARKVLVDAG